MNEWMNGSMHGWMDGWMGGWVGRWVGGVDHLFTLAALLWGGALRWPQHRCIFAARVIIAHACSMIAFKRKDARHCTHIHSHLEGFQTMPSVALRRLVGDLHSVAKQPAFETPFIHVPIRFWSDLGRFWEIPSKWR